MYAMPAARKSGRCGWKWNPDTREYEDTGKGCGQKILIENLGKNSWKITNDENGRGGKKGERHLCHNTGFHDYDPAWKGKYRAAQLSRGCVICGVNYNGNVFVLCPNCFHKQCRKCGASGPWKMTNPFNPVCVCGSEAWDIMQQQWSYNLRYTDSHD